MPDLTPGLSGMAGLREKPSTLLGSRMVDRRTPEDLSRCVCQDILEAVDVHYSQGMMKSASGAYVRRHTGAFPSRR